MLDVGSALFLLIDRCSIPIPVAEKVVNPALVYLRAVLFHEDGRSRFASVVVGQFVLVLGSCIDRDHMRLCGLGLRLQGGFQLLRGHISMRDVLLDILNDLRLDGLVCIRDLNVTDKEGLVFSKLVLLRHDLGPQVIIGFLQSFLVRDHHSLLHRCSLAAFDLQGALFQIGAVNRNRGTVLRKGGGVSVQLNRADLNLEPLCQHCLGILRRQNIFFLFRSGIGNLFVVLVSTGEVALFILCVGLAVVGQGAAVLCNCPILVAVISDRFIQFIRFIGLFLGGLGHRPRHGGSILKPDIGIACGCQFFQGLAACLFHQVLLSQPIQLIRGHAGSVTVGDGVGRGNRISVIIRGGKLIAGELSVDIDLLRFIRYIEHTGIAHGCGILAFLALRSPADGACCHIRRAGDGVVVHIGDVLGFLAGVGFVLCGGARNRCPSGAVGQGVGLAANLCRKGVALVQLLRRKGQAADFCLQLAGGSLINAQSVHCLGQGIPGGVHLSFFRSDLLTGGSRVALLRGLQSHFISEAPAEKLVLCYVQLNFLLVRGGVVDLAVRTQFVVLVAIFFQSVNDLCVAQRRSFAFGANLNNVLLAVRCGVMDSVIRRCTLIEHLFQILGLNGLNHFVAILDLDTGVCHLVSERFTAILLCLLPGDGQLGGGLSGNLATLNGDVGGTGLGVALCVQNGLGPGEGIGAVGVHRGLFGIHQLGDVFSGHLSGGLFLFLQLEGLLVAIVGHILYLVAVDRVSALFNIPADVRVLAQLLVKIDFFDFFLFLVQIARGRAAAGGGGGLLAGGHGGLGDGGGAVRVLLHSGRGGGVHNGLCAGVGFRLHVGLGLLGLFSGADLLGFFLLGLFLFGLFLLGGSLTGAGVRVWVGLTAVGVGVGVGVSLAALGVGHDHAIQLLGAVRVGRGVVFIVFDFRILQGLLSVFRFLIDLRFCGVFLFLGFLRHRLRFFRSCFRSICVCCQRACGHTGGQGHGHCRHLQFLVRHGSCSFPESCCLFQGDHRASIIAER